MTIASYLMAKMTVAPKIIGEANAFFALEKGIFLEIVLILSHGVHGLWMVYGF